MIPFCILVIENDDDRDFMISLYNNYKNLMFFEVGKIVKGEYDREDVVQDVLIKLIDKISLLRSRSHDQQINYIISACKHTALNYIRDHSSRTEVSYEDYIDLPDTDHDGHEMDLRMIKGEELETLRRMLPKMDSRSQRLLEGYYFLDMPMAELAKELKIKPSSVRMSLTRARKRALELLQEAEVGGAF